MDGIKIKFVLKNNIETFDEKTLQYLYQPIITAGAYSLYRFIIEESYLAKKMKSFYSSFDRISKFLNIKDTTIEKHLKALEGMGLLQRFSNKNKIIFNIFRPLDPIDFINHIAYNKMLQTKIGKEQYEFVRLIFSEETTPVLEEEFVDSTSAFYDVFPEFEPSKETVSNIDFSISLRKTSPLLLGFNLEEVLSILLDNGIDVNPKDKEKINIIKNIYSVSKISNKDLASLLIDSYDSKISTFDKEKIGVLISRYLLKSNEVKNIKDSKNLKANRENKIKEMESYSSERYISFLLETSDINKYKPIIKTLRTQYALPDSTINCIFEFSYLKNNKIINQDFIYKAADKVISGNLKNTSETMVFLAKK